MEARQKAWMAKHDVGQIKKYRRTMIHIANETLNGNQTLCEPHDVHSLLQTLPMPSPPMHTVNTVAAADLYTTCIDLADWTINAGRILPAGGSKVK